MGKKLRSIRSTEIGGGHLGIEKRVFCVPNPYLQRTGFNTPDGFGRRRWRCFRA